MWTASTNQKIKRVKKLILKRKIMLSFIIDNYSWYDKAFRWSHIAIAVLTPVYIVVKSAWLSEIESDPVMIILSSIVAGLVKLRDYVTYDKVRDLAKEQTVKYSQLYDKIDQETIKPNSRRLSEENFLHWLHTELKHIEFSDPELSYSDKQKFIKLCKSRGIPYDEDLDELEKLMASELRDGCNTDQELNQSTQLNHPTQNDQLNQPAQQDQSMHRDQSTQNDQLNQPAQQDQLTQPNQMLQPIQMQLNHNAHSDQTIINIADTRPRSVTDDAQTKSQYKQHVKTLNNKSDLQWAVARLNQLNYD